MARTSLGPRQLSRGWTARVSKRCPLVAFAALVWLTLAPCWTSSPNCRQGGDESLLPGMMERRAVVAGLLAATAAPQVSSANVGSQSFEKVVVAGDPFSGHPRDQVKAANKKVKALLDLECWTELVCDGDEIRRYMGTVGTTSPLFKLETALQDLYFVDNGNSNLPDLDQIVERIRSADYLAYSSIFSMASGGQSPKTWIDDCLTQVKKLSTELQAVVTGLAIT
ncbi:unnamed protein product [Polarella glacialis]|uniref:Uncharacterized protein n=1 Tax=Polarella glacialis TaxID=89957 RepID=A0A813JMK3_POLGL|nr:unnamed protein product [Polarella glacialis]